MVRPNITAKAVMVAAKTLRRNMKKSEKPATIAIARSKVGVVPRMPIGSRRMRATRPASIAYATQLSHWKMAPSGFM